VKDCVNTGCKGWFFSTLFLCVFVGLMGCGRLDHSVVGSDAEITVQDKSETPAGFLVFVPPTTGHAAAKKVKFEVPSGDFSHRATESFDLDRGGKLEIEFEDEDNGWRSRRDWNNRDRSDNEIRVEKATFSVKKRSIDISNLSDEEVEKYVHRDEIDITMAVSSGSTLEDVAVGFGPSGLIFDPEAKLELKLTGNLKDLLHEGKSYAYHIDEDGQITKVEMDVDLEASGCKLRIDVPGFSRYTIDD